MVANGIAKHLPFVGVGPKPGKEASFCQTPRMLMAQQIIDDLGLGDDGKIDVREQWHHEIRWLG